MAPSHGGLLCGCWESALAMPVLVLNDYMPLASHGANIVSQVSHLQTWQLTLTSTLHCYGLNFLCHKRRHRNCTHSSLPACLFYFLSSFQRLKEEKNIGICPQAFPLFHSYHISRKVRPTSLQKWSTSGEESMRAAGSEFCAEILLMRKVLA